MSRVVLDQATRIYAGTSTPDVDALELKVAVGEFLV